MRTLSILMASLLIALPTSSDTQAADKTLSKGEPSGVLLVTSNFETAEVWVDGDFVGNTPAKLKLPIGRHKVRVSLQGHPDWIREVRVYPESESTLRAAFKTLQQTDAPSQRSQEEIKKAETCTIRGNVVWKYNEYVGTKPDVGAVVLVLRHFVPKRTLDWLLTRTDKEKGVYRTTVDMLGKFEVAGLPSGTYDILIRSENTKRNISVKFDPNKDYNASPPLNSFDDYEHFWYGLFKNTILTRYFKPEDWEKTTRILLIANKYTVRTVIMEPGDVEEIYKDFGNTYY